MKKFISLIVLIFTSVSLTGQVGISKTDSERDKELRRIKIGEGASFELWCYKPFVNQYGLVSEKKNYTIYYANAEYKYIYDGDSVSFEATEDEIKYLFDELKSMFKGGESKTITLGYQQVRLTYIRNNLIRFSRIGGGYNYINAKDLHALFAIYFNKKAWRTYLKS
jgi:hypothetical protein